MTAGENVIDMIETLGGVNECWEAFCRQTIMALPPEIKNKIKDEDIGLEKADIRDGELCIYAEIKGIGRLEMIVEKPLWRWKSARN